MDRKKPWGKQMMARDREAYKQVIQGAVDISAVVCVCFGGGGSVEE